MASTGKAVSTEWGLSGAQLGLLRVLTGIGIGGSQQQRHRQRVRLERWRGPAVSLNSTGYALGATLGGVIAVALIGGFGWRSVFLFGGVATLVAIPLVGLCLPESLDFLLARRPHRALERVNALARKLGRPPLDGLPEPTATSTRTGTRSPSSSPPPSGA